MKLKSAQHIRPCNVCVLRVPSIDFIPEQEYERLLLKITPTRMLILSDYNGEFQHRFRSKCYRFIFLNLPPMKNMEVIPFIFIPEQRQ